MDALLRDLRFAVRTLMKSPAVTLAALLTLALGIGATTAIFTVVDGILLKPLSYPQPDRLMMVWETNQPRHRDRNVVSPANFLDWQAQNHVFASMSAFAPFSASLTGQGDPRQLDGFVSTADLFTTLQTGVTLGRGFQRADGKPGSPPVIVISNRLWRQLGGTDGIVGRTVTLGGRPTEIVGVLPAGFRIAGRAGDFISPLQLGADAHERHGRGARVIARLAAGVTLAQARAEMDTIATRLAREYPDFNSGWGVNVVPLASDMVSDVRPALLLLLAAVGLVLLVACVNVANLLLARASGRRREFALRAAIGAGRGRLLRQLLTESLLLAGCGGALGLVVAAWLLKLLLGIATDQVPIPRLNEVHLNPQVLLFVLAVTLITGLAFGLAPALTASRLDLHDSLKEGRGSEGQHGRRRHDALVVAEVALALVLLMGAGLMLRSFWTLTHVDPGFRSDHVLSMWTMLPGGTYRTAEQRAAFFDRAVDRLQALPGAQSAAAVTYLPLTGLGSATTFWVNDRAKPAPGQEPAADVRAVTPDYFRTLGIPLLRGRTFSGRDRADSPQVAIVNEALARMFWPGRNPIGQRITYSWGDDIPLEIVGVVGDARLVTLSDDEIRPAIYRPQTQQPSMFMSLVVRTAGDPLTLAPAARAAIHAIDPNQPLSDVASMETVQSDSLAQPRLLALLLGLFGFSALLLAAVGIYGVMAYAVARRTQEIGVRMALGADRSRVVRLVVGRAMWLAGLGLAIGLAGALATTRVLDSLLYGITATDPATFVGVPLILAAVALVASLLPARRATRIDPMVALRTE